MADEGRLRERIIPRLLATGVFAWSNADAFGQTGIPDTSFAHEFVPGFLEYKAVEGRLKKKQRDWMVQMAQAGGLSLVVRDYPEGKQPWCATYQYVLPDGRLSLRHYNIESDDWLTKVCLKARAGRL